MERQTFSVEIEPEKDLERNIHHEELEIKSEVDPPIKSEKCLKEEVNDYQQPKYLPGPITFYPIKEELISEIDLPLKSEDYFQEEVYANQQPEDCTTPIFLPIKEELPKEKGETVTAAAPAIDNWEEVTPDPPIFYVDFVSVDEDVAMCGEVTDVDIVAEVLNNNIHAEDVEAGDEEYNYSAVQERPILSVAEAMDPIQELRLFWKVATMEVNVLNMEEPEQIAKKGALSMFKWQVNVVNMEVPKQLDLLRKLRDMEGQGQHLV
uniref:Uncharacterized protein n=1 Tax=Timema bartmani TaxID=61472 RepID=A0A7R9F0Y4_9NEOP|nr:unnamed protein product [Timema bartmani]